MRHRHLQADCRERALDVGDQLVMKVKCHGHAGDQKDNRADQTLAQFVKVLHQAHARQLYAVGDSRANRVDHISHG